MSIIHELRFRALRVLQLLELGKVDEAKVMLRQDAPKLPVPYDPKVPTATQELQKRFGELRWKAGNPPAVMVVMVPSEDLTQTRLHFFGYDALVKLLRDRINANANNGAFPELEEVTATFDSWYTAARSEAFEGCTEDTKVNDRAIAKQGWDAATDWLREILNVPAKADPPKGPVAEPPPPDAAP